MEKSDEIKVSVNKHFREKLVDLFHRRLFHRRNFNTIFSLYLFRTFLWSFHGIFLFFALSFSTLLRLFSHYIDITRESRCEFLQHFNAQSLMVSSLKLLMYFLMKEQSFVWWQKFFFLLNFFYSFYLFVDVNANHSDRY